MKNNSNQKYIKEMEKNSKIFEEKLNKFKKYQDSSVYNEDDNDDYEEISEIDLNKFSQKKAPLNTDINERPFKDKSLKNNPRYKEKYGYNIEEEDDFNYYDNKRKEKRDYNEYDDYESKYNINKRQNYGKYNNYKYDSSNRDEIIEEKRTNLTQKSDVIKRPENDFNEKEDMVSKKKYNDLLSEHDKMSNELDTKTHEIKDKESEIKNLKLKLENIFDKNKNMKSVIEQKNDQIENMKSDMDIMKEEIKNSKSKFNDLLSKHKSLMQDYDNLNKDYSSLKNDNQNLNSVIEDLKADLFNSKKEINELKKIINKLKSENQNQFTNSNITDYQKTDYEKESIKEYEKEKEKEERYNKRNYDDYDNRDNNNNYNNYDDEFNEPNIKKNNLNIKNNRKKELKGNKSKYKLKNRNAADENYDNDFNSNSKYNSTEYNNYNKNQNRNYENKNNTYDDFDDDENQYIEKNNNIIQRRHKDLTSKYNYKNKRADNDIFGTHKMKNTNVNKSTEINMDIGIPRNEIKRKKSIESNEQENNNKYITIVFDKDKMVGCDKEKVNELVSEREFKIIQKELSVLITEKNKLENRLLKMPEHPKTLSDIRTKREVNDIIDRIESDIGYIRILLKKNEIS